MEQNTQNAGAVVAKQGWSWGGFAWGPGILLASKRYHYLWWYLLAIIPFVNIVFFIVFAIYLGVNGHKITAGGTQFSNQSEYDGFTKGTDHAGKILFIVGVVLLAIWLIVFVLLGASFLGMSAHTTTYMPGSGAGY